MRARRARRQGAAACSAATAPATPASSSRSARRSPTTSPFAISSDPIDPEEARYAPRPPRRFAWLKRLLAVAVVVGLVWMRGAAAWSWSQDQYYVGEDDGTVAIFRGINAVAARRRPLAALRDAPTSTLDRLSDFDADQVREGIDADEPRRRPARRSSNLRRPDEPGGRRRRPADVRRQGSSMGFVHRRRRGAELFLLVLALAVGIGAYAAVGLGVEGKVPPDILAYGGWLAALVIAAHVVVRIVAPYADPVLLPVVAALNGLGLAVIHRLDLAYADDPLKPHGLPHQQLIWMTLGVVLFIATLVLLRDHRVLQRFTYTTGLAAIVLLLLPLLPGIGDTINGARIWINLGPFSFQPGEVAKVLLVIAFAGYLVLHRDALALAGRRVPSSTCPAAATSARSSRCG